MTNPLNNSTANPQALSPEERDRAVALMTLALTDPSANRPILDRLEDWVVDRTAKSSRFFGRMGAATMAAGQTASVNYTLERQRQRRLLAEQLVGNADAVALAQQFAAKNPHVVAALETQLAAAKSGQS